MGNRLKRKEEEMLQKRVKCLVKVDAMFTSRKDTEVKTGEKGRRQLQQRNHSQTLPINDLFGNSPNFWASFPSLPCPRLLFTQFRVQTWLSTLSKIGLFCFYFRKFTECEGLITRTAPENTMSRNHPNLATLCLRKFSKTTSAGLVLQIPLNTYAMI